MNRCLIIGEVGQAHDGSLGNAHAFIDAIANAGADAVKFQTHIARAESSPLDEWRVNFSRQDKTRYDYWRRMEFTEAQWNELRVHAKEKGLQFLSSPFSIEAVDLLSRVGVDAWKIASGELGSSEIFAKILASKLPLLISSGMSSFAELDSIVATAQSAGCDFTIFQCTSLYPTPPEKLGLNLLSEIRYRYNCKVGLSDHSGTVFAGFAAAAIGLDAIEVHVTFSREMFGPDVIASITTSELRNLVDGIRFIERAIANPVDKDAMANEMQPMRRLFSKSIFLARDVKKGNVLTSSDICFRKPGTGILSKNASSVLGKKAGRDLQLGNQLKLEDIEP